MFGPAAAYVVAISTIVSCGIIALTLITTARHFDPPVPREAAKEIRDKAAA